VGRRETLGELIPGKAATVRLDSILFFAEHESGLPSTTLLAFAILVLLVALAIIFFVLRRETKSRQKRQDAAADPDLPPE
jgi:flagellar biosynthesis/type III secretory pathway M-ring protein FliF/YscJ